MNLPEPIAEALKPLFEALPINHAMGHLVVRDPAPQEMVALVEQVLQESVLAQAPALAAGLWLYVDDLDRSHEISQSMKDATGSYWHGIMHRREGDFGNSHYWFDRTGQHPAMALIPDHDAHAFVDEVSHYFAQAPEELLTKQRQEWWTLFCWCANQ